MNPKKQAGYKAAELIKNNQIVGLGTGSTTHYFIEKLGERLREGNLKNIQGIPTSYQSFLLAKENQIPCTTLDEHTIDIAVDGADEIDPEKNLIKGGGAAHTLEKIIDYSADQLIIIADSSKEVPILGKTPVPLEVIKEARNQVQKTLKDMDVESKVRMGVKKDGPVITDNGNFIIDAEFNEIPNPISLEKELNTIPGVVENGIFTEMVDIVIIGTDEGTKIIK